MTLVALFVWMIALGLTGLGTWWSRSLFKSSPPHLDAPFNLYPVSIIKPLKGIDSHLESNLEGFFKIDYPDYELIFCVAHASDPAYQVATRLIARYPRVKAQLLEREVIVGPNPKVNNMMNAYEAARHDWVLISDSNVSVQPDYLKRLVAHLKPGVGLVTAIVSGRGAAGLGGGLEATYLNTFYCRGMNLAAGFGHVCVIGKSMLFRRSEAARFGGLRALGKYLAEDFMAGEAMQRLGLRVVIACDPVVQMVGDTTIEAFWRRHLRWGRIRKRHGVIAFAVEPFLGAIVSGLLGAWSMRSLFGIPLSSTLLLHLSVWSAFDVMQMRYLKVPVQWTTPLYWFTRELFALPLWLHIASGNTVNWRGHKLALGPGGMIDVPIVT